MDNRDMKSKIQVIICDIINNTTAGKLVYLSGKVTDLDPAYVAEKFNDDVQFLNHKGFFVFNPTEHIEPDCDWQQAMKLCLAILPLCDYIYMQPDADDSKGAQWEEQTAERLGIKVVYAPNFKI